MIAIRAVRRVEAQYRDAQTGRVLLPWEPEKIGIEELARRVAAGDLIREQHTIEVEEAHLGHHCPECDAGRELEGKRKAMLDAGRKHDRRTGGD